MKITYNWLKEFIDIDDNSPQQVADILTDVGIEVNSIRYAAENLEKVVTGKIVEITKHPNADKLQVCQVDVGGTTLQIVTGATNVFKEAVVPVALHGSKLPTGVRIKKSKLRGIVSNGMLCSEEELGLTASSSGIMILPNDVEVGKDVKEILGLNDWVIEYEITTNRADALSVLGIARELKAVLNRPIKLPEETFEEGNFEATDEASLSVLDEGACPRYDGFVVKGIKNATSPLPVQVRLYLVGSRPINAVVDATNYVMYELGQPLHAFDLEKLKGKEVVVRRAMDGEKIVTLDGVERKLIKDDLVIADSENPVAIAGIMGGEETGTSLSTENILLESAHFNPLIVRRTSKRLGISTDASYRFERGADIEATTSAASRALHLIQRVCGGKVAKGKLSFYPKPYTPKVIVYNPERATRILGVDIPPRDSFQILSNLGFTVKKEQGYIVVKVPSWRKYDVTREIDLIEETVRIYGMKNVISTYPLMHSNVKKNYDYDRLIKVKELLTSFGLNEVVNFSFIGEKLYGYFGLPVNNLVKIANPLSEDWVYMRNMLLPSLVQNAVLNINRNEKNVSIFEVARVFENRKEKLPAEPLHLAILLTGGVSRGLFKERTVDFYDLKGIVENLLCFLRLNGEFESISDVIYLHPGQSAKLTVNGKKVGFIGKIHPDILETFDVKQDMFVGELQLDKLLEFSKNERGQFEQIPKFPPVTRDIAVLVDADTPVGNLERIIRDSAKHLEKLKIFDVYMGKGVPQGKKNVAFSLIFRNKNKTLSDEEISKILNGIIKSLEKSGATLRA